MISYTITVVFLLVDLLSLCSCQSELFYESENIEDDKMTVLLGGLFPIHATTPTTACGELSKDSVQRVESMVNAINGINENSELLPNIKLAFSIRDTCSDPSYGLEQAFQFVQSRNRNLTCLSSGSENVAVSGVVGAQFSRVSLDIANLLRLYNIPQISYISTADILGDRSRFDYFFRTIPPDTLQARAIADMIVFFKWKFVFMLYSDDTYGGGGIDAVIEHLQFHNSMIDSQLPNSMICVAARIPLSVTATSEEYDAAIRTMNQDYVRNATVAVLFGHVEAAVGMMQALKRSYMQGNHVFSNLTWIGTDSWGDSLPSEYHSIPGGILSVLPRADSDPSFDSYFTSLSPATYPNNVWFNELWESRFGCSLSRDAICGIEQGNMTLNTADYRQASQITLVTDAVYSFAHAVHNLVERRCSNSILCDEILENRLLGKGIIGELLREQLFKISFQGPSSNLVSFNENGTETGAFFIKNLQQSPIFEDSYTFEIVGLWDHELALNFTSDIEWATGDIPISICTERCERGNEPNPVAVSQCCKSCSPCESARGFSDGLSACQDCNETMMPDPSKSMCIPIPVNFLDFSNTWSILLLTLTIIGLIATSFIITVFLIFHKHLVIKASSRELSAFLLIGLILCFIMPFFFAAMPSQAVCAIRRFGVGVSFSICFSALLVKTNRIYRIFNQKSLNPTKPPPFCSPLSQVIATLILISIQVIGSIIWIIVQFPLTVIDYQPTSAELRCGSSPVIYLVATLSYNFILLLFSTYFAFLARKVPHNFNEAKFINVTLYTLCIIWLAFISTYFATIRFGSVFQATSLMIAIILSAATTLVCIFMPKVVHLFSRLRKEHETEINTTNETKDV